MLEKMFGWMKLNDDDEIEEVSHNDSITSNTNGSDNANRFNTELTELRNKLRQEYEQEEINLKIHYQALHAELEKDYSAHKTEIAKKQTELDNNYIEYANEIFKKKQALDENFKKYEKNVQDGTAEFAKNEDDIIQDNIIPEEIPQESPIKGDIVQEEQPLYISNRKIILGVHIHFIDVAREIINEKCINSIPLMREYHLQKSDLDIILKEMHEANILGQYNQILMSPEELERFLDIYEPTLFNCQHTIFNKEIFLCIGEIIFDKGVDDAYNSMNEDEVLDYLTIMEKLKIITYNSETNEYDIISSKKDFIKICECIPCSFSNEEYIAQEQDYQGKDFDNMSGLEFERYCGYILEKNSFSEIKITQASGDHGIDILAEKCGINYAFQCKCYSNNVGNKAIQQAHTGKDLYHRDVAVVMTNRYFTKQAQEEAKQLGVKLWDRNKLLELIGDAKTF